MAKQTGDYEEDGFPKDLNLTFFESLHPCLICPVLKNVMFFVSLGEMFRISLMSIDF